MCHHESTAGPLTPGIFGTCRFCQHDDGPTLATFRAHRARTRPVDTRYACQVRGCLAEAEVTLYVWASRQVCGFHADMIAAMGAGQVSP
jgi:hypothetical protein